MIALLCAPCRLHSVSNHANAQNGTDHGEYKAMKGGEDVMKVCSFTARERPMVQKVLQTTIQCSETAGFGVVVENPCAQSGPTVGSFFHVYAEFVKELYFNLICHCAWGVEWQKSTGIATLFAWQPVGKRGSGGKCVCRKAHKYMIHGPADRRPRVPGLAYHAAVCALPRGMLEEVYCAFEAREAEAIRKWDESSTIEKIQAVSLRIDERVHEQPGEDDEVVVVVSSVAPFVKPGSRRKQQSVKCVQLGLTNEEIQSDTARMLADLVRDAE
jgi:hypothetical protein